MFERKIDGDQIHFYVDGKDILTVTEGMKDESIVVSLRGELRSEFVYDLQDELMALVTVGARIIVDMKELSYLSSTAQHAFLKVQQKTDALHKGSLILSHLSADTYKVFEETGLADLLMFQ